MQLFKLSPPILELSTLKNISVEIFCFSEICFIFKLSFKVEDICSWASQVAQLKNPPANAGEMGSIPRSGRSPGEGNGNPLQCSCLENPMDRGAWWGYSSWSHKESESTEQLTLSFSPSLRLSTTHYTNTTLGLAPPHS